jgi:hypothetical protein
MMTLSCFWFAEVTGLRLRLYSGSESQCEPQVALRYKRSAAVAVSSCVTRPVRVE